MNQQEITMSRLKLLVLAMICAVALGACQQTGTAPPSSQDTDGLNGVGDAHGP